MGPKHLARKGGEEMGTYASSSGDAFIVFLLFFLVFALIALAIALFVFMIWGIIDVVSQPSMDSGAQIMWAVIIWLTSGIAGVVWIFWGRKNVDRWPPKPVVSYPVYAPPPGTYPPGGGYPPAGTYPQAAQPGPADSTDSPERR